MNNSCISYKLNFGIIFFLLPLVSFSQNYEKLGKQFTSKPPPGSIIKTTIISQDLADNLELVQKYNEIELPQFEDNYAAFSSITRAYKKRQESNAIASTILRANNEILKHSIAIGAASASGPLYPIVFSAMEYIADTGLDGVADYFDEKNQEDAEISLSKGLSQYRKERGVAAFDAMIDKFAPEGKLNKPRLLLNYIHSEGFLPAYDFNNNPNLDKNGKAVVRGYMEKESLDLNKIQLKILANQGDEIGDIKDDIKQFKFRSQALWNHAVETDKRVVRLEKNMIEVNKSLGTLNLRVDSISNDVSQNKEDINFLQSYVFGNLSPKEKKEALQNGFFKDMDPTKRKDLEKKIELENKRQEIIDDMSYYIKSAGELVNIGKNIGLKGEFVDDAGKLVQAGSSVMNGVIAWKSMDYISAVSSFSNVIGVFGKKGNASAKRHQQLVSMLSQVLKNQKLMMDKLDAIANNQKRILETQKNIYEQIILLGQEIQKNHSEVMGKLDQLNKDVIINRWLMKSISIDGYQNCISLFKTIPDSQEVFKNYEERAQHYNKFHALFSPCRNYLAQATQIGDGKSFHERFSADNWIPQPDKKSIDRYNNFSTYWDELFEVTFGVLESNNITFEKHFLASLNAVSRTENLDQIFVQHIKDHSFPNYMNSYESLVQDPILIKRLYHYPALEEFSFYLYWFLPYWELTKTTNDLELIPLEDLYQLGSVNEDLIKVYVKNEILRLDISIYQQQLLSGANIIPYFYKTLCEEDGQLNGLKSRIKNLLAKNQRLAENFLLYSIRHQIENTSNNYSSYHFALQEKESPILLNKFFGSRNFGKLKWYTDKQLKENKINSSTNWVVEYEFIGNTPNDKWKTFIPLPNMKSVKSGIINYPNELYNGIHYRMKFIEYYNSFDVVKELKQYEWKTISSSLLSYGISNN